MHFATASVGLRDRARSGARADMAGRGSAEANVSLEKGEGGTCPAEAKVSLEEGEGGCRSFPRSR